MFIRAAVLRPQTQSEGVRSGLELAGVQFIIGEVENTDERITALWLQLERKVTLKHAFFVPALLSAHIVWLQLGLHFKQR